MTITEPATLITDWLLAAQCTVLARRLGCDGPAARLLRLHLLVAAVGAFLGGLDHGFQLHLSAEASHWIWTGTLAALVVASTLLLAFAVRQWLPGQTLLLGACGLLGLAGLVAGVPTGAFEAVLALWVPSTAAVLVLAARSGARLIVASQLVAILGAAIQALELAPHPAFNHNDLFHVVQMGAILLLVRGAREVLPPAAANLGA